MDLSLIFYVYFLFIFKYITLLIKIVPINLKRFKNQLTLELLEKVLEIISKIYSRLIIQHFHYS